MHTRPFLLGAFALGLVLSLSACRQANQTTPVPKVSLVASGQTHQPRIWYGITGQSAQPKPTTKPAYLVVVQNRTAITYMLPTGKQALTMKRFNQLSTNRVIDLARVKDHQAYTQGVRSQQATLTGRIKGIQSQIDALNATAKQRALLSYEANKLTDLKQYLKLNQVIRNNPQRYTTPTPYQLTASLTMDKKQTTGENFNLKTFPVDTVQYGDANVITTDPQNLGTTPFTKRLTPVKVANHYYAGYQTADRASSVQLLTRVKDAHYRIVFDGAKVNGVSTN